MPAHPRRSASAKGGTSSGGWSSATPSARRAEDEIRAPTTLVEAIHTRLRTWVQFPPSPPHAADIARVVNPGDCRSGTAALAQSSRQSLGGSLIARRPAPPVAHRLNDHA